MRFPYNPYVVGPSPTDPSGTIWCPELVVSVRGRDHDSKEILLNGLVDPGSDDCILPYDVAGLIKATPFGEGHVSDYTGESRSVEYLGVYFQLELEKQLIVWPSIVTIDRADRFSHMGKMRLSESFPRDLRRTWQALHYSDERPFAAWIHEIPHSQKETIQARLIPRAGPSQAPGPGRDLRQLGGLPCSLWAGALYD